MTLAIEQGIEYGFCVGVYMLSAQQDPKMIENYIKSEVD